MNLAARSTTARCSSEWSNFGSGDFESTDRYGVGGGPSARDDFSDRRFNASATSWSASGSGMSTTAGNSFGRSTTWTWILGARSLNFATMLWLPFGSERLLLGR